MKSDTSNSSEELEDSGKESNKPLIINNLPRSSKTGKGGTGILTSEDHVFALQRTPHYVMNKKRPYQGDRIIKTSDVAFTIPSSGANKGGGAAQLVDVSATTKSTNMQSRPITKTLTKPGNQLTLQGFKEKKCQTMTFSQQDFLAKVFLLLGKGKVSKIQGELSFLISVGLLKLKDHHFYSLKMSKAYYPTMKGKLSVSSSRVWMNWGMMSNGRCLTANTSESHRTGNECSLSDILEEQVQDKYFLSEKALKSLINHQLKQDFLVLKHYYKHQ